MSIYTNNVIPHIGKPSLQSLLPLPRATCSEQICSLPYSLQRRRAPRLGESWGSISKTEFRQESHSEPFPNLVAREFSCCQRPCFVYIQVYTLGYIFPSSPAWELKNPLQPKLFPPQRQPDYSQGSLHTLPSIYCSWIERGPLCRCSSYSVSLREKKKENQKIMLYLLNNQINNFSVSLVILSGNAEMELIQLELTMLRQTSKSVSSAVTVRSYIFTFEGIIFCNVNNSWAI